MSPLTGYLALGRDSHLPDLGVLALGGTGAVAIVASQVQLA